ncbi:MAG TPA: hypothetical protein VFE72_04990 [Lysobacter sp.]|nr:hypothetical protein [Lysobacter sp.]
MVKQTIGKIAVFAFGYAIATHSGAPSWAAMIGGWVLIAATAPWRCRGCGRG